MEKYEKISETQVKITKTDEQIVDTNELELTLEQYKNELSDISNKITQQISEATASIQNGYKPRVDVLNDRIAQISTIVTESNKINSVTSKDNQ